MRHAVAPEHLQFFHKHHYIEFENLLTEEQLASAKKGVDEVLAKRLNTTDLENVPQADLFISGRDIWRESPEIKQILSRPHLGEIASQLTKVKPLRLAYDQVLRSATKPDDKFNPVTNLLQSSSLQGLACGLILNLCCENRDEPATTLSIEEEVAVLKPLSQKPGNGIFFTPEIPFSLQSIFELPAQNHLLIVYCQDSTVYRTTTADPFKFYLQKFGYVFGDRLKDETHPIVFK